MVEKDLIRDGMHLFYDEQIQSEIERGEAFKMTQEELGTWSGPGQ